MKNGLTGLLHLFIRDNPPLPHVLTYYPLPHVESMAWQSSLLYTLVCPTPLNLTISVSMSCNLCNRCISCLPNKTFVNV